MKFAELHAGRVLELGACKVSAPDILEFARRYDPQPFHVDEVAARATRWQGLIASGFHTCSLAMRMVSDQILQGSESMGSPGLDYVKWPNPVRAGDDLHLQVHILEASVSKSGRVGIVRWQWQMRNQHGVAVLDLAATSLFSIAKA